MSNLQEALNEMRNMRESYNDLAKEINEDKKAIIHEMQLSGMDIDDNASMAEVAERMREYTLIVRGNTEFVEGSYIRSLGDAIFDGLASKELVSIETELPIEFNQSWMSQENNILLKKLVLPNAIAANTAYLRGCTELEYVYCPVMSLELRFLSLNNIKYIWCSRINSIECQFRTPLFIRVVDWISPYGSNVNFSKLRHFYLDNIDGNFYSWPNCDSLYDCRLLSQASSNKNFSFYGRNFNPSAETINNADEWDDPDQPHFANNGEKALWYFKHHFLYLDDGTPAFFDMSETTSHTLTLASNLRDLVMQDADVAEYFSSRNWTVA